MTFSLIRICLVRPDAMLERISAGLKHRPLSLVVEGLIAATSEH
jgi:hypothetical protein